MSKSTKHFHDIGQNLPNATQSQMFGKPCYKINKKAFICYFKDSMVFKLNGDVHAEALKMKGSKLFDPSGKNRPMKEWVQVSFNNMDKWEEFALNALKYVGQ